MTEPEPEKKIFDYAETVAREIPLLVAPAKKDGSKLEECLTNLLALEKKTRLAADADSTVKLAKAIIELCKSCGQWKVLNENILLLCKRRAQLQKVVHAIISDAVGWVEATPDKPTKVALIETLRTVSMGKMFVELERARLTKTLSEMKEAEGDVEEACAILQDVQVETIGSMDAREKGNFLLEQVRLCLAKKDFVRGEIISKKVNIDTLNKDDMQDLKIKYYNLVIQFHTFNSKYLKAAQAYRAIYNTPSVLSDAEKWKSALKTAAIYLLLSPFDSDVSAMLATFSADLKMPQIEDAHAVLEQYTKNELMDWPLACEKQWLSDEIFAGEKGKARWADLHKRVVQHNIRVIAKYYGRISASRLAQLLKLEGQKSEDLLSEMVSDKQLYAKIDRPTGIITFQKAKDSNQIVNEWSADINTLLSLVESTCHMINKENMIHKIKTKA